MSNISFRNPPTLYGERITLIPLEQEHAHDLLSISHPDIWTYMLNDVRTIQDMNIWVTNALKLREQSQALPFLVILNETNEIVGTTRLYNININQKSCELGSTWYSKKFQRTFVNSECKYLLLKYCFEELHFIRIQIKTDERNLISQRAIERLGAIKEGIMRKERILPSGYIRNAVVYSITDDDWSTVKKNLKGK